MMLPSATVWLIGVFLILLGNLSVELSQYTRDRTSKFFKYIEYFEFFSGSGSIYALLLSQNILPC